MSHLAFGLKLLRSNNWAQLRPKPATPVREELENENEMIEASGNNRECVPEQVYTNLVMH